MPLPYEESAGRALEGVGDYLKPTLYGIGSSALELGDFGRKIISGNQGAILGNTTGQQDYLQAAALLHFLADEETDKLKGAPKMKKMMLIRALKKADPNYKDYAGQFEGKDGKDPLQWFRTEYNNQPAVRSVKPGDASADEEMSPLERLTSNLATDPALLRFFTEQAYGKVHFQPYAVKLLQGQGYQNREDYSNQFADRPLAEDYAEEGKDWMHATNRKEVASLGADFVTAAGTMAVPLKGLSLLAKGARGTLLPKVGRVAETINPFGTKNRAAATAALGAGVPVSDEVAEHYFPTLLEEEDRRLQNMQRNAGAYALATGGAGLLGGSLLSRGEGGLGKFGMLDSFRPGGIDYSRIVGQNMDALRKRGEAPLGPGAGYAAMPQDVLKETVETTYFRTPKHYKQAADRIEEAYQRKLGKIKAEDAPVTYLNVANRYEKQKTRWQKIFGSKYDNWMDENEAVELEFNVRGVKDDVMGEISEIFEDGATPGREVVPGRLKRTLGEFNLANGDDLVWKGNAAEVQEFRSEVRSRIAQAYDSKNNKTAARLKKLEAEINAAIEEAVGEEQWNALKDIDDHYSVYKKVFDRSEVGRDALKAISGGAFGKATKLEPILRKAVKDPSLRQQMAAIVGGRIKKVPKPDGRQGETVLDMVGGEKKMQRAFNYYLSKEFDRLGSGLGESNLDDMISSTANYGTLPDDLGISYTTLGRMTNTAQRIFFARAGKFASDKNIPSHEFFSRLTNQNKMGNPQLARLYRKAVGDEEFEATKFLARNLEFVDNLNKLAHRVRPDENWLQAFLAQADFFARHTANQISNIKWRSVARATERARQLVLRGPQRRMRKMAQKSDEIMSASDEDYAALRDALENGPPDKAKDPKAWQAYERALGNLNYFIKEQVQFNTTAIPAFFKISDTKEQADKVREGLGIEKEPMPGEEEEEKK